MRPMCTMCSMRQLHSLELLLDILRFFITNRWGQMTRHLPHPRTMHGRFGYRSMTILHKLYATWFRVFI